MSRDGRFRWWDRVSTARVGLRGRSTQRSRARRRAGRELLGSNHLVEHLEGRTLLAVTLNSSLVGLNHVTGFGSEPPDTITAAGPKQVVELVNFAVAFYDKAGNLVGPGSSPNQVQGLSTFFAPAAPMGGSLGAFLFDPLVTYDDVSGRFVLSIMDAPNSNSFANFLDVAISNDSNTADGFTFTRLNVQETSGTDTLRADNQRIGWNADAWVIRTNMIDGNDRTKDHTRLDVIYKSNSSDHSIDGPNVPNGASLNFAI